MPVTCVVQILAGNQGSPRRADGFMPPVAQSPCKSAEALTPSPPLPPLRPLPHVLCEPGALEACPSAGLASALHLNHLTPGLSECTLREDLKPNGENRASHQTNK